MQSGASSEHFSDRELACHHCGVNACTAGLVAALEALRAAAGGQPVTVHDAYRCPQWNEATPHAATHSQHMDGTAADISIVGMNAAALEAIARTVPTITGIGRNDFQGWVHIDVRPAGPAEWCYAKDGSTCAYYCPPPA